MDRLVMVEALPIPEALTHHGGNQVRQVLRIQLVQVVQVLKIRQAQVVRLQQVRCLIQDVQLHQTLLVKQVTQRLQM